MPEIPILSGPPTLAEMEEKRRRQEEEQDRKARNRQTKLTVWNLSITCVLAGLTFWQGYLGLRNAKASEKAANAAESAAKTAGDTLKDSQTNSAVAAKQFETQLSKLDQSITEANELAKATAEMSSTSREALTSVQRPYLVFMPRRLNQHGDDPAATLDADWQNLGNTPVVKGWTRVRFVGEKQLPRDFNFPFMQEPINHFTLGAHLNAGINIPPISKSLIPVMGTIGYVYGWAVYQDIFKGTAPHLTEFCVQLYQDLNVNFNGPSTVSSQVLYSCPDFSCLDGACKDYDAKMEEVREFEDSR